MINVGVTINATCKYNICVILLFGKDSKPDSVFEDKEWTFVIEDVSKKNILMKGILVYKDMQLYFFGLHYFT